MDYPKLPFLLDSVEGRDDPVLLSIARSGAPKTRRLYERPRRRFRIVERGLSDAMKATIDQFLTDNRMTAFTIYWPCKIGGVAYSVIELEGRLEWTKPEGFWSTVIQVIEA